MNDTFDTTNETTSSIDNVLQTMRDFTTDNKTAIVATSGATLAAGLGFGVYKHFANKKRLAAELVKERQQMVAVVDQAAAVTKILIEKDLVSEKDKKAYEADLAHWAANRETILKKIADSTITKDEVSKMMAMSFVKG